MSNLTINAGPAPAGPQEQQPTAPAGLQVRVGGAVSRATFHDDTSGESSGVTRASVSDLVPSDASGGLLSTAFNPSTGGPPATLSEHSVVTTAEGMQVTVKVAMAMGLIRRDAMGNFSDVQGASLSGPQAPEGETEGTAQEVGPVAFDDATEAACIEFAKDIPAPVMDSITAQIIEGGIDHVDMRQAATAGHTVDAFREGLQRAMDGFQQQADVAITKLGVDPGEFYAYAKANDKQALTSAMREHAASRSPHVYAPLVERFLRSTTPATESIEAAGIASKQKGKTGDVMVEVNGMTMSARVASRLGWI